MARGPIVFVAWLLLPTSALAGVRVDAEVPFAADDLALALDARNGPPDVVVLSDGADAVQVQVSGRTYRVALGPARGRLAARIVAAHLADVHSAPSRHPLQVIARRERTQYLEVSGGAGVSGGVQRRDLMLLRVAADVRGGRTWRWMAGLAWGHGLAASEERVRGSDVGVARAGLGLGVERADLVTGPLFGAYRIDGGSASGWMVGWHGGLRVRALASDRWRVHATVDGEWFQHRIVVRYDGAAVAATPRVALSAGVSVGWELQP